MVFCIKCRRPYPTAKDYNDYVKNQVPYDFICADCTGNNQEKWVIRLDKYHQQGKEQEKCRRTKTPKNTDSK